jgi:3'-5' exoribonuclease
MDKIWAKDVKEGERVKSLFLVARKAIPTAKSGKTYLAVTLHDKTGELEARAFDKVEELSALFEEKDAVEVEGQIGLFQGKPQMRIESAAKVDLAAAGLDPSELVFVPAPEPKKPEKIGFSEAEEALWKELLALVEAVADPHVRNLVQAFLDDEDVVHRLRRAPAAKSVHHAYPGGLLEHTVSCLKLSHRVADHYPQVDRDLLVAGAFFHDLGKIRELSFERQVEYTDEGRLVGHLVMTAQWIHDKARRVGVPRDLEHHVVHLVLSHHGRHEYGSPKQPMTLEALITHAIDDLDSRMNSWLNLMGREGGTRRWTDSQNLYEQHIWRGTLPTLQVEKKGPPADLLTPVIYVPREGQAHGGGEPRRPGAKKPRRDGGERPQRPAPQAHPRPEAAPTPAATETAPHADAAEKPRERPERTDRPPRPDRPDRGPRGGPGDRKRGYMGPRLPGDKGPQGRPDKKPAALTHNPFAALARKVEGSAGEPKGEKPAEPAAEAPPEAQAVPPEPPAPEPSAPAPEPSTAPAAEPTAPAAEPTAPAAEPTAPAAEAAATPPEGATP